MRVHVKPAADIEIEVYDFLSESFRLECEDHQRRMGFFYITEPGIELAYQITRFAKQKGYIVCESTKFFDNLLHRLRTAYVERIDHGIMVMTAEIGNLAQIASHLIARQLA